MEFVVQITAFNPELEGKIVRVFGNWAGERVDVVGEVVDIEGQLMEIMPVGKITNREYRITQFDRDKGLILQILTPSLEMTMENKL